MAAPILVVGAGTTGLTVACELARHGAAVRIVDALANINPHCRASSLHARTLEIFTTSASLMRYLPPKGSRSLG